MRDFRNLLFCENGSVMFMLRYACVLKCMPAGFYVLIQWHPMMIMDGSSVKRWAIFFTGILSAIIIADTLSSRIVTAAGLNGWTKFVVSFVLYAALFFGILHAIEKLFHISFFRFGQE